MLHSVPCTSTYLCALSVGRVSLPPFFLWSVSLSPHTHTNKQTTREEKKHASAPFLFFVCVVLFCCLWRHPHFLLFPFCCCFPFLLLFFSPFLLLFACPQGRGKEEERGEERTREKETATAHKGKTKHLIKYNILLCLSSSWKKMSTHTHTHTSHSKLCADAHKSTFIVCGCAFAVCVVCFVAWKFSHPGLFVFSSQHQHPSSVP